MKNLKHPRHSMGLALWGALAISLPARATSISTSGSWSGTVDASRLSAGAGSDLVPTLELLDQASLSVFNTSSPTAAWTVTIRREDYAWNPNLTLSIERTGSGSGSGTVSGGSSYLPIGLTDSPFLSGSGDLAGISIGLSLSGLSVRTVPPDTYSTLLVLTVMGD